MAKIILRLYAALREAVGKDKLIINVSEKSSVKDVIRRLFDQYEKKIQRKVYLAF